MHFIPDTLHSTPHTPTVFVGLSGGVDSAVSAALLKEAGYSVIGVFIKIWRPEFADCPWREERLDAMRVAAALEIPFREIDLSDEYKKTIIDDMIKNYASGLTPNPDVLCNRHIKFGAFASWAFAEGADFVATGHYARVKREGERYHLLRGKDTAKDQSYFLWQLTEKDLSRILFPVGEYEKSAVRTLAQKFNIPVATKRDSQGLCFVGDVSMRDFLKQLLPVTKGTVVDEYGTEIGEHDGAALYTLGERHGLHLYTSTPHETPQYISKVDTKRNVITVSKSKEAAWTNQVILMSENWLANPRSQVEVQTRYHGEKIPCTIEKNTSTITFERPHLAPSGKSVVCYEGDRLLGGGIIRARGDSE